MEAQIQELYKPLFFYVKNRINGREDAEDITQEVFYKLFKSNDTAITNVKSWVYTIAKNTITDYYRKKVISTESLEDQRILEEYNDENAVQELGSCMSVFIDKLPDEYRELIKLSELDDVPQKEIAERLQLNYATVRSKVQRGRKKLRDLFSSCCVIEQGTKGSILSYEQKQEYIEKEGDCFNQNQC